MMAAPLAPGAELAILLAKPPELMREALLALPLGIHPDVPELVYHAKILGYGSKSALDLILRSPARYWAWLQGLEKPERPALRLGRAVHMAILEPERFASTYLIEPDFGDCRHKGPKAERDAWRKANAGAVILGSEDDKAVRGMALAVAAHKTARALLLDGLPEVTAIWQDADTGLRVKARADYYLPDIATLVDIKSTTDARPQAFQRTAWTYRYFVQHALYVDGFRAAGAPVEDFVFVACEKEPPYDIAVYQLDSDAVARGRAEVAAGLTLLASCLKSNDWPGYGVGIQTIGLPSWA